MTRRVLPVALLLFLSGMCADLPGDLATRIPPVFGGSTAASGGVGDLHGLLGDWATPGWAAASMPIPGHWPLCPVGVLVALSAAVTPLAMALVRSLYLALGGQTALGLGGATVLRLGLAALVIGLPTLMMGGTLPAAARAVTTAADTNRRNLGLLYGLNTLGAVAGALLGTFYLLETFGMRRSLWLACAVNLAVAALAGRIARASRMSRARNSFSRERKLSSSAQRRI